MRTMRRFWRRRTQWLWFGAVLVPLVVLLALQYTWLVRLQEMSAIAHKAALTNYVEAVGTEVQYFYRSRAERGLNLPAAIFLNGNLDQAAKLWSKKTVEGARRLFLVSYVDQPFGAFLVYDPHGKRLVTPPASDESSAMIAACTPWMLTSYRGGDVATVALSADERDPQNRIILNPITDESSRVVGVAGMVLDESFFHDILLPAVVSKALPAFFPDAAQEDLVVTVRDGRGQVRYRSGEGGDDDVEEPVMASFPFVYTDWSLGLRSRTTTPEQWARAGFVFNMTLSMLLAVMLTAGIALSLGAANRAVHLSEMKSDFVSNVSHELRTPLASIRVFAEFLKLGRAPSPERVREYGEYIEAESRRLTRLINNILDFSRIESGQKTYEFVSADLEQVVAATLATFRVRARNSGFEVQYEPPVSPLPPQDLDVDAIGQALNNLLDNAVKYSGDARRILVRLFRDGDQTVCTVRDYGIGIPQEQHRKIFERFHRVGTGLVHDVKGSGLGLSIVHHIVQAHRGELTVESEPGDGTTIGIRLPLPGEEAAEVAPGEVPGEAGQATGRG